MKRLIFEPEHEQFRETVRAFISREIEPYSQEWEAAGQVDRDVYRKAGEAGLLGFNVPEEFGGGGVEDAGGRAVWGTGRVSPGRRLHVTEKAGAGLRAFHN